MTRAAIAIAALLALGVGYRYYPILLERGRISELISFTTELKKAQDHFIYRQGIYYFGSDDLNAALKTDLGGPAPGYGLRNFNLVPPVKRTPCIGVASGQGFQATFKRVDGSSALPERWGAYVMVYDRCTETLTCITASSVDCQKELL